MFDASWTVQILPSTDKGWHTYSDWLQLNGWDPAQYRQGVAYLQWLTPVERFRSCPVQTWGGILTVIDSSWTVQILPSTDTGWHTYNDWLQLNGSDPAQYRQGVAYLQWLTTVEQFRSCPVQTRDDILTVIDYSWTVQILPSTDKGWHTYSDWLQLNGWDREGFGMRSPLPSRPAQTLDGMLTLVPICCSQSKFWGKCLPTQHDDNKLTHRWLSARGW